MLSCGYYCNKPCQEGRNGSILLRPPETYLSFVRGIHLTQNTRGEEVKSNTMEEISVFGYW